MAGYLSAVVMLLAVLDAVANAADARHRILSFSACFFLGYVTAQRIWAWRSPAQIPDEFVRLKAVQVVFRRWVARIQFFYTIRGLLKTLGGF
jgi:hypothetical protein